MQRLFACYPSPSYPCNNVLERAKIYVAATNDSIDMIFTLFSKYQTEELAKMDPEKILVTIVSNGKVSQPFLPVLSVPLIIGSQEDQEPNKAVCMKGGIHMKLGQLCVKMASPQCIWEPSDAKDFVDTLLAVDDALEELQEFKGLSLRQKIEEALTTTKKWDPLHPFGEEAEEDEEEEKDIPATQPLDLDSEVAEPGSPRKRARADE